MNKTFYDKLPIIDVPYDDYAKTVIHQESERLFDGRYRITRTVESGNILRLEKYHIILGDANAFIIPLTPIGISSDRQSVYFMVSYSRYAHLYYWLRFLLKNINSKILYTLYIWELADHEPGMVISWSDVKLVKWIKQWLRK